MQLKKMTPFLAFLLLLSTVAMTVGGTKHASADVPSSLFNAPSNINPTAVYAHGDGSVTVADNNCPYYYAGSSAANSTVTLNGANTINTVPKVSTENLVNWQTQPCFQTEVVSVDGTSYVVQTTASPATFRVVAARDNLFLWTAKFEDPDTNCTRNARVYSLKMGDNGKLYAVMEWLAAGSCVLKEALVEIDPITGTMNWVETLPGTGAASYAYTVQQVFPYNNGVAVLNGTSIYHYSYSGVQQSGTFSPTLDGASIYQFQTVLDTGRVFLLTQKYNGSPTFDYTYRLFYKDLSNSAVTEITLSSATGIGSIHATPSNGVVAYWVNGSSRYFSYFNSSGSLVYQQYLNNEMGHTFSSNGLDFVVDNDGNVIVRRQFDKTSGDQDRNVIVDSFSPTGTMTRLFNSANSSLATAGLDSFTSTSRLLYGIGGGQMYMILCHNAGSYTSSCNSAYNPKVLAIDVASTADYPRSHVFTTEGGPGILDYVALGDSFTSGEGVPEFIPPSDTNDCDRSWSAYPVVLKQWINSARLRAFRACSGATTLSVYQGMNGEPGQLDSLSAATDLVTITIGGNDVYFKEFAEQCVLGTCDAASSEYQNTMNEIDYYLYDKLIEQYGQIRSHAPNAVIYVAGYPQVVPSLQDEPNCDPWFSQGERVATRSVVVNLNLRIQLAVQSSGLGFQYVDPTAQGSPFVGHELCTPTSYFNGLNIAEHVFSFHPNELGQGAYAELFYGSI